MKPSLLLAPVFLLAAACSSSAPVSVLKPESEKIHLGMQPEEVQALCGKPQTNITDPLSGSAMWIYKDPKVGDRITVSFSMDGVAKISYAAS